MSAKHTPGPWNAAGKHITQDDGGVVAYVTAYAKPTPRQLADARLIAAAPELLAALEEAFKAFAHDDDGPVWADSTIRKARAAIAKAKGEAC